MGYAIMLLFYRTQYRRSYLLLRFQLHYWFHFGTLIGAAGEHEYVNIALQACDDV